MVGSLSVFVTGKAGCTTCNLKVTNLYNNLSSKRTQTKVYKTTPTTTQWVFAMGLEVVYQGLYSVVASCGSTTNPPCSTKPVQVKISVAKNTNLNLALPCVAAVTQAVKPAVSGVKMQTVPLRR